MIRSRVLFVAMLVLAAACAVRPGPAAAYGRDGVFVLTRGFCCAEDVAMLPDSSVLVSNVTSSDSAPTWRVWPDGHRERVRGFDSTGLAVAADGTVYAVDGTSSVVRRWLPGAQPVVVAGVTDVPGFAGDGGSALAARLSLDFELTRGILPLPGGAFLFTDSGNNRIRGVDQSGVITTVADGRKVLDLPTGLAAGADGGFIVGDEDRLRYFHADGGVQTLVSAATSSDVVSLPDGTVLWTNAYGQLRQFAPADHHSVRLLASGARLWDFAARSVDARGLSLEPDGGLLIAGFGGIVYRPMGPTPWALVALRASRIGPRQIRAVIEATAPGTATLELIRRHSVAVRARAAVPAGHSTLRVRMRPTGRCYRLRGALHTPHASVAHDGVMILAARALSVQRAKRIIGYVQDEDVNETVYRSQHCRAFGSRRVDCEVRRTVYGVHDRATDTCDHILSVGLRRSGVVLERTYACGNRRRGILRRHPHWNSGGPRPLGSGGF